MKRLLKKIFFSICTVSSFLLRDSCARVLMYHSFKLPNVFFNVDPKSFFTQIEYLIKRGYIFCSVNELVEKIKGKQSLKKVVVLTFDDGHIDFLDIVMSFIKKHNIPVTLFWPSGLKDNVLKTSQGDSCSLISFEQIKTIFENPLVEIGCHGHLHNEFTSLSPDQLKEEMRQSLSLLSKDGKEVSLAYPRGKYSSEVIQIIKHYVNSAFTVEEGFVDVSSDLFKLPRLSIDSGVSMFVFKAKLSSLYGFTKKWLA